MKNLFAFLFLLATLFLARTSQAQVGIGTNTPNTKSAVDIQATDKGLLIPRLTAAQRTAIASPPQGLMVYQTDGSPSGGAQSGFWYYVGTGGWVFITPDGDNLGNHTATQNLQLGTNQLLGNGGTRGLRLLNNGDARLGKTTGWTGVADNQVLRFGDSNFVTIGEAGGDDLMQLRARNFIFQPSGSYSGNVGIGTNSPTSRLDVAGTITVSGANTSEVNRAQTGTANLLPICYGNVNADATINAAGSTANFTVTKAGTGIYDIMITGESYFYINYTTVASLNGVGGELTTNSISGTQLRVFTYNSSGATADRPFNFITYKP
ncbi:hypothetical protein [Hymenobacter terrenus]|uniref:hypothetical protein n=1 Tax=Hymenobacter terrenus TaxID=1629124 RepID=UPI000619986B|nr:hypothetical protein [Hymenobacter terrenus]